MKHCALIIAGLLSLVIPGRAQQQNQSPRREKPFIQQEIERYKSLIRNRSVEAVTGGNINATYYKLDLRITTTPQYLRGVVTMKAFSIQDGVSQITLDLMQSMTIDSVRVGGVKTSAVQHSSSFDVTLDRSYNTGELMVVEIFYRGRPGASGMGSFEFSTHASKPWVYTLSEPYGAKDWWPCKDHPLDKADSADIIVTCDSSFRVGSNGKLISVIDNGNGTKTHHWQERYPIATYLICVAMTNYAQFSNWFKYSPIDSMEVLTYALPEDLSTAVAGAPFSVDGLRIYSSLFGLYPFINEKYGHAEFGWGGAMEHQTMTYTCCFSEDILVHELSHHWFGDMITCRTWPDIWLNEGFATYCEALYFERKYGISWYWAYVNSDMSGAKHAVGSIYVQDTSDVNNVFDGSRSYDKGGVVLHMLRHVLGDSAFFHSMYNYANTASLRFSTASTSDFQAVCESTSGKSLGYFFNEWIYGENYPHYIFGWSASPSVHGYTVTVPLGQATGTSNPTFFTMPIDLKVVSAGWDTTVTVLNDSALQTFTFDVSHNPTSVQLDPDGWILKDFTSPIAVSPSRIEYGIVTASMSKTDSVTVTNQWAETVTISSVTSDMSEFTITPTSATIAPLMTQKFYVTFSPTSRGIKTGHITFGSGPSVLVIGVGVLPQSTYNVSKYWNMLSLPIKGNDPRKSILFPTAVLGAYKYMGDAGYAVKDSMFSGFGYWLRFNSDQMVSVSGIPIYADTINVKAGWNLVGSISKPLLPSSVLRIGTAFQSLFYGYNKGYQVSDTIQPGKGYWIKMSADGQLILDSSASLSQQLIGLSKVTSCNDKIIITDHSGNQQTLYFGEGSRRESDMSQYELPPKAPNGMFDVRFSSNRMLELIEDGKPEEFPILISSAEYPIRISWEMQSPLDAALEVGTRAVPLTAAGGIMVGDSKEQIALRVTGLKNLPREYSLNQNYPNPFNPLTVIGYELPVSSYVTLKVFDVLGREVAVLVDEQKDPGSYTVSWNASMLASGVYYYRMVADAQPSGFMQVRRCVVMK